MSSGCRGQAGSTGRGAGEGIASLGGSKNLSRESMLFFICPLKTGDIAGRGRVRRSTRVIISTVGIIKPALGSLRYRDYELRLRLNILLRMIKTT